MPRFGSHWNRSLPWPLLMRCWVSGSDCVRYSARAWFWREFSRRNYSVRPPPPNLRSPPARPTRSKKQENAANSSVVLHIHRREHRRSRGMLFFVASNGCHVLQGGSDVVEALEQHFLARGRDLESIFQSLMITDGLVR